MQELARFGLVDYDWSNSKGTWVDNSPMNCEEMQVEQAGRNKALNRVSHSAFETPTPHPPTQTFPFAACL